MAEIHKINQDDVLGRGSDTDDLDLSPSEFGAGGGKDETPVKKNFGMMPMIGGVVAAVAILGVFGWKILTPYFGGDRGGNDRDAFAQIATPKRQAFAPEPAAPLALPASVQAGEPGVLPSQAAVTKPAVPVEPVEPEKLASAPPPVQVLPAAAEIAQINKRIDGIATALAALKDTVEKMQTAAKLHAQSKPVPVVAAAKPVSTPVVATKKPADGSKPDVVVADAKPAADVQLQAVLQDRAWFKTKAGETITASVGEEVKGVGLVKQIDADGGRVVFTSGAVYR